MTNILRTEFFRLRKYKTFWVMLGIVVVLPIVGWALSRVLVAILLMTGYPGGELTARITFSALSGMADIGTLPDLLGLICTAIFLSKEFTDGTIRNAILSTKTRKQIYFGYLVVALTIGLSLKIANYVSSLTVYGLAWGFGSTKAADAAVGCFASLLLALLSTAFVQSCTVMFLFTGKKQSTALIFPILIVVVGSGAVELLVSIVELVININGNLSEEWKTWIPLYNVQYFDAEAVDGGIFAKIATYWALFTAMFIAIGHNSFKKADLK